MTFIQPPVETAKSVSQLEAQVGDQLRRQRMLLGWTQARLAESSNVSLGSVRRLERGQGATVTTLVSVVRALDQVGWLGQLSPQIAVSPLQLSRDQRRNQPRQRVYAPRRRSVTEVS